MHDHVRWYFDTFGRERVVRDSDYPNVSGVASDAESRNWLRQVDATTRMGRDWMTGRSLRRHVGPN